MNVNLMMRLLPQVLFAVLLVVISFGVIFPAHADIPLDNSKLVPNNGRPYWEIWTPGN